MADEGYCMKCRAKREFEGQVVTLKNGRPAAQGTCPVCGTKLTKILGMDAAKARGWSRLTRDRPRAGQFRRDSSWSGAISVGPEVTPRWRAARSATVVSWNTCCTARATSAQNPCSPQRESAKHV